MRLNDMRLSIAISFLILFWIGCSSFGPPPRPDSGAVIENAVAAKERYKKSTNPSECGELLTQIDSLIATVQAEDKYSKYADSQIADKNEEIQKLRQKNSDLTDELWTWRTIKWTAIISFVGYILLWLVGWYLNKIGVGSIGQLVSKFRPEK
jgi:hypothetical protein